MTDTALDEKKSGVSCPHCGEKIGLDIASKLMNESKVSLTLHPHTGEFLSATTVGGSIVSMAELLIAENNAHGLKTNVLLVGLSFDNGAIKADLLITRQIDGLHQRGEINEGSQS